MKRFGNRRIPASVLIPLAALLVLGFPAAGIRAGSPQDRVVSQEVGGAGILSLHAPQGPEWEVFKAGGAARPAGTGYALGALELRLPDGRAVLYQSETPETSACHSPDFSGQDFDGLRVSRKLSVSRDGAFLRWLNIFANDTDRPIAFEARMLNAPGAGGEFGAVSGERAGAPAAPSDRWLTVSPGPSSPLGLGWVLQGRDTQAPLVRHSMDAPAGRRSAGPGSEAAGWTYCVELAPGQTGILLTLAAAGTDPAEVGRTAASLAELKSGALSGLSPVEKSRILNFSSAEISAAADPVGVILTPPNNAVLSGPTQIQARIEHTAALRWVTVAFVCSTDGCHESYFYLLDDKTVREPPFECTVILDPNSYVCSPLLDSYVEIFAQDVNGNGGGARHRVYLARPDSPLVVDAPADGSKVQGIVKIAARMTAGDGSEDESGGVNIIGPQNYELSTGWRRTLSYDWDTNGAAPGFYTIQFLHSYSPSPSSGTSWAEAVVGVEVLPQQGPSVRFAAPRNGQTLYGTIPVEIELSAPSGLRTFEFFVDGEKKGQRAFTANPAQDKYQTTMNAAELELFTDHTLSAAAVDGQGRRTASEVTIRITGVALGTETARLRTVLGDMAVIKFDARNPDALTVAEYVLYRKVGSGGFEVRARLSPDLGLRGFLDPQLKRGVSYTYSIEVLGTGGAVLGRTPEFIL